MEEKKTTFEKSFFFMGILFIIGGCFIAFNILPGEAKPGYMWKTEAFIPAITYFASGLIGGFIFFGIGSALFYLRITMTYSRKSIADNYDRKNYPAEKVIDQSNLDINFPYLRFSREQYEKIIREASDIRFSFLLKKCYVLNNEHYQIKDDLLKTEINELVSFLEKISI